VRILVSGDIRYTPERHSAGEALAEKIRKAAPDVFVLSGNLGSPVEYFESALSLFATLDCRKAAVTGNLDLWQQEPHHPTSQTLWEDMIPSLLHDYGYVWLERDTMHVDRVGICGTMAWYDYSGRDIRLGYGHDIYPELKGLTVDDARFVSFQLSDEEFAALLQEGFSARIDQLEADTDIDHVVAITHFPVYQPPHSRGTMSEVRARFNYAYEYNLTLVRVLLPKTKLRHVVSSHVEESGQWTAAFGNNRPSIHVIGTEHLQQQFVTIDL